MTPEQPMYTPTQLQWYDMERLHELRRLEGFNDSLDEYRVAWPERVSSDFRECQIFLEATIHYFRDLNAYLAMLEWQKRHEAAARQYIQRTMPQSPPAQFDWWHS